MPELDKGFDGGYRIDGIARDRSPDPSRRGKDQQDFDRRLERARGRDVTRSRRASTDSSDHDRERGAPQPEP